MVNIILPQQATTYDVAAATSYSGAQNYFYDIQSIKAPEIRISYETPQIGNNKQEAVRMVEDFAATTYPKLKDTQRDGSLTEETQKLGLAKDEKKLKAGVKNARVKALLVKIIIVNAYNVSTKASLISFQENNKDILALCYSSISTYVKEAYSKLIALTHSSIDGIANYLKYSEQDRVTQRFNEVDAYLSNIYTEIVVRETRSTHEAVDENDLLEEDDDPQEGKDAHETRRIAADFDTTALLKLEDSTRYDTLIQETSQTLANVDESLPLEVKDSAHEGKLLETVTMVENFEANTALKLGDNPRNKTLIDAATQRVDYVDEDVLLEVREAPQEEKQAQETARLVEYLDADTLLKWDRNLTQTTSRTFDYSDENAVWDVGETPQVGDNEQETVRMVDDFAANAPPKLKDTQQEGSLIEETQKTLTEVEANVLEEDSIRVTKHERKDEETTIKCVDDNVRDNFMCDLNLEESNASLLDESEIPTTPKRALESESFEISYGSYSIDIATQLLFEWLRGQEEVTSYYSMNNEIVIHVKRDDSDTSTIDAYIKTRFPQLLNIYRIEHSDPGMCLPCVRPTPEPTWTSEHGKLLLAPSEDETIYPGREICCKCPASDTMKTGTFSGKIRNYGITVGHITSPGLEIVPSDSICCEEQEIGAPIFKAENVRVPIRGTPSKRVTLADVLFFRLNTERPVINTYNGDPLNSRTNKTFNIVLHKGPVKENDSVMVILKNNKVKFGRVASADYNNDTVLNALYIVDENNLALTEDGDSGAIVVLLPNGEDLNLRVIGVVTHLLCKLKPELDAATNPVLNAENSISSGTIVNRLYKVLLAIQQGDILGVPPDARKIDLGSLPECIEFSRPQEETQFDSGIQAQRSQDDLETVGTDT